MAVKQFTFNLTTAPIELTGLIGTDRKPTQTIAFNTNKLNNDTVMIGTSSVSDTNFGIHLDADGQFVFAGEFTSADRFYARAKASTAILHVLVIGA